MTAASLTTLLSASLLSYPLSTYRSTSHSLRGKRATEAAEQTAAGMLDFEFVMGVIFISQGHAEKSRTENTTTTPKSPQTMVFCTGRNGWRVERTEKRKKGEK